jgi:hypothetical protein
MQCLESPFACSPSKAPPLQLVAKKKGIPQLVCSAQLSQRQSSTHAARLGRARRCSSFFFFANKTLALKETANSTKHRWSSTVREIAAMRGAMADGRREAICDWLTQPLRHGAGGRRGSVRRHRIVVWAWRLEKGERRCSEWRARQSCGLFRLTFCTPKLQMLAPPMQALIWPIALCGHGNCFTF